MKLAEYLSKHEISREDFARRLGVSEVAITRYIGGKRMPRRQRLEQIVRLTHGEVTPNDFIFHDFQLEAAPSHEAAA